MGNVRFSFDEDAFAKLVEESMPAIAATAQPEFDSVFEQHKGEPVETVLPHVRALAKKTGITPADEKGMLQWATLISEGTRLVLTVSGNPAAE